MSLKDACRKKMNEALKSGNKAERIVYSSIVSEIVNKEKELCVDSLNKQQEIDVVMHLVKQNQDSIDKCPDSRQDILNELAFERDILSIYMPKQMDENEINLVIDEVLNELNIKNPTAKEKGKIMKILMPKVRGRADGKVVNSVLASRFI